LILSTHGRIHAVEYVEICSINHRCFTQWSFFVLVSDLHINVAY
jgi:hypothetical protein